LGAAVQRAAALSVGRPAAGAQVEAPRLVRVEQRVDLLALQRPCEVVALGELGADPLPSTVDLYQQITTNATMPRPD